MSYFFFKRFFDVTSALVLTVLLMPMLMLIALLLIATGEYPLYYSIRGGLHNRPFKIYKFKTMTGTPAQGTDAERLTGLGKFLRFTSLDELPQLVNVLKGEMSMVGPRPLPLPYYDKCTENQKIRYNAKPGLAGPVQALGRNSLSWARRFELDVDYVKNQSFATDMRWIFKTLLKIMVPKRIETVPGEAFTGQTHH